MEATAQDFSTAESACPRLTAIETTLYDLLKRLGKNCNREKIG
jgi:hypothetical protein